MRSGERVVSTYRYKEASNGSNVCEVIEIVVIGYSARVIRKKVLSI